MQYFESLPKIIYTDDSGIPKIATNIMARASMIPSILKNPVVYYQYDLQEDDTPEIVAHKYYGTSYVHGFSFLKSGTSTVSVQIQLEGIVKDSGIVDMEESN